MLSLDSAPVLFKRHLMAFSAALLVFGFGLYGIHSTPHPPKTTRDFALVHTGAECFLDGCNPYNVGDLDAEAALLGEVKQPALPWEPVYPPSTFLLLRPFARAGWPASAMLWEWLSLSLFALACVLVVERFALERYWVALLLLAALATSHAIWLLLYSGNPSLMAGALTVIACLLLVRRTTGMGREDVALREPNRWWRTLGFVLLGVALSLKVQVAAGPAAVLLLHRGVRREALKAFALAALVLALSVLVFRLRTGSFEFLTQLGINNRLALAAGRSSDPSPANPDYLTFLSFQAFVYFLGAQRPLPGIVAWTATAGAAIVAFVAAKRNGSWRELFWTSLAFGALLTLVPVYHRSYDRVLLLLIVPAVVELYASGRKRLAWWISLVATFWFSSDTIFQFRFGRLLNLPLNSLAEVPLCALLLWAFWTYRRAGATSPTHSPVEILKTA